VGQIQVSDAHIPIPSQQTTPASAARCACMRMHAYAAGVRYSLYGGYTLRSEIEAPLITREVLPETYFLLVIMAADARARPFLQFQASC
jgi:hypothetical protein